MVAFEVATPFRWLLCWGEASCGHSGLSPQLPLKSFANSGRSSHVCDRKSTPGASVHKVDFGKFCGGGRRDNSFAQWTCFLTSLPFLLPRVCLPVLHYPPDVTMPKPSISRDIRVDCAYFSSPWPKLLTEAIWERRGLFCLGISQGWVHYKQFGHRQRESRERGTPALALVS